MNRLHASLFGALLTVGLAAHAQAPVLPQPAQGPKQNITPGTPAQVF